MNEDESNNDLMVCEDCGAMVPPANMQMHQLRGCPNRKRPAVPRASESSSDTATSATGGFPVNNMPGPPGREPPQNPNFVESSNAAPAAAARPITAEAMAVPIVQGVVVNESQPQQQQQQQHHPPSLSTVTAPATPPPAFAAAARASSTNAEPRQQQQQSSPWDRISSAFTPSFQNILGSWCGDEVSSSATTSASPAVSSNPSSNYPATRRRKQSRQRPPDSPDIIQVSEVVNLVENDNSNSSRDAATATATNNHGRNRPSSNEVVDLIDGDDSDDDDETGSNYWSCPRCTLRNPEFQAVCDACLYSRHTRLGPTTRDYDHDGVRSADATRTDQLIPTNFPFHPNGGCVADRVNATSANNNNATSPSRSSYVSSGAVLGSVLGAAGALARGQPASRVARATIDGAVGGAMGGLAMDVVFQEQEQRRQQQQQQRRHRQRSEPQVRVYRTPGGGMVTTYVSTRGGGRGPPPSIHEMLPDPMMELLMHQSMMGAIGGGGLGYHLHGGGGGGGQAGMNYEQLLHMFGDGTENLGGTAGQIESLPTATVADSDTGKKGGQCSICLQHFETGDSYKTLPCLHNSFHTACIDQWLKTNAACPICKHRLE